MTKPIYVDYPALQTATANFSKRHESLQTIIANLEAGLAPMIATWDGAARDLYLEQKAIWDSAAADLTSLLQTIIAHTQNAHDGYSQVVSDVKGLWT
jgi:6 kDa early secretory antigenic target